MRLKSRLTFKPLWNRAYSSSSRKNPNTKGLIYQPLIVHSALSRHVMHMLSVTPFIYSPHLFCCMCHSQVLTNNVHNVHAKWNVTEIQDVRTAETSALQQCRTKKVELQFSESVFASEVKLKLCCSEKFPSHSLCLYKAVIDSKCKNTVSELVGYS